MGRARHRAPLCSLLLPTVARAAESAGDLSSVVSAIGDTYDWPEEFAALKERLRPDAQLLREAWQRLDSALDVELAEIARRRRDAIPVVDFSSIQQNGGRIPSELEADVRKRGVVIVRGVVDSDQARGWKTAVQRYARDNPSHVGFPKDNPQVLELYWSKPQLEARQHANMHATMLAVNRLWSGGKDHVSFEHAFSYGERLRIRQPGKGFSLHPHTDGGSIERFEDPHYQSVYRHVWEGRWEEYDPWAQADERALANVSMYAGKANGYCTTFRAFQGWMSISSIGAGPDAGTLKVLPLLKEATARIMMRPFLDDVPAADFCGAIPGMSHDVTPKWHGKLHAGLVPLPAMAPGDTVWWHADLVHAVEALHNGTEDSSVLYIPSFPATARNAAYVAQQRERFREGRTPPDFPPNDSEMDFSGRGTEQDLTAVGRSMLGFEPLSRGGDAAVCSAGGGACVEGAAGGGATSLLAECDRTLGF
eukprot:CAMPEP_0204520622 /NCGR_PEP_ID=MMETSP0661-20131031/5358_1 /ASSEMBLY_ACC=CAM_ASM_000606 /TAXON_ID=109239 /ORGANISM="Alexandrium margalefi, Strain AMGDE01CS-322" /LENGTH=477 /DNA_ID=CAMNT_0051526189 /DNA_START=25 /DNA_END=1458 /DNA_ORIENTATION=-